MYRGAEKQTQFIEFNSPFGGKLLANNRWIRLFQMIPWHEFEDEYCPNLSKISQGPPAFSVRMALAALIIKERLGISDEECTEQFTENPYLQYFSGLKEFTAKAPFRSTMFIHFRKRFPADVLVRVNGAVVSKAVKSAKNDDDGPTEGAGSKKSNKGNLPFFWGFLRYGRLFRGC